MGKKYTRRSPIFTKNIRENNGVKERRCTQCGEWKPETAEYFYRRNKKKPEKGFQSACIECSRKDARKRLWENLEEELEKKRIWKENNKDKNLGYMRKFYQEHKEERRKYLKDWFEKNPEKAKYYMHRSHDITDTEWLNCKKYFEFTCAYCGLPLSQHLIPRNDKIIKMDFHKEHADFLGANDLRNCVPSCGSCNSTKNLKTVEELFETKLIANFTQERYNKIIQWLEKDHKKYLEPKPPYKITRKQNEDGRTYHWELWTVDELRNMIECIAIADKKQGLKPYIQKYFPEVS